MTRLFLAAGVAALAITVPASAKPGEHGGGNRGDRAESTQTQKGGGKARAESRGSVQRTQQVDRAPRGGNFQMRSVERRSSGPRLERRQSQRFATLQQERGRAQVERRQTRNIERRDVRNLERRQVRNVERRDVRNLERRQVRNIERRDVRNLERRQAAQTRMAERRDLRGNRAIDIPNRIAVRDEFRGKRLEGFHDRIITRDDIRAGRFARLDGRDAVGYGIGGCPPGLASKGCIPPGQAAKALGVRLSDAGRLVTLGSVPLSARYLYPDTDDYFYRYGDGYLYRVDREDQLISALLPLAFGGGYYPGSYFPSSYMNRFYDVPSYYGFNSFYPSSYAGYGYGYDNLCNRYVNGLIYQVDCRTGFVEDVIPLYAGGYGVGQLLPTGYGYYNVPYQYRDMYYDSSDYGYWYAPGAIYQYDPSSSMITSVAALLSPGFSVGQPLPYGYDAYNVPYGYRASYYDTPDAWYRYNNGYIYQVDPTTRLVTALVASILT
jgi:hypothetical protein